MQLAAGLLLGIAGGGLNLALTRLRARWAVQRGMGWTLVSLPFALVPPAAAVVGAAQISPACAWISPLGLVLARWLVLRKEMHP